MYYMYTASQTVFQPNDLLHYGVKGMKWYQHIFGDDEFKSNFVSRYNNLKGQIQSKAMKGYSSYSNGNKAMTNLF